MPATPGIPRGNPSLPSQHWSLMSQQAEATLSMADNGMYELHTTVVCRAVVAPK